MTSTEVRTAYRIETERLVLRCWSPTEAGILREAIEESDEHLRPWIPWMIDEPRSLVQTADWLRTARVEFDTDTAYRFAMFTKENSRLLGEGVYFPRRHGREIGYWLRQSAERKGYAYEAAAALVKVAFENDRVDRVEIVCAPANAASAAIPEKLGFKHEATLKRRFKGSDGEFLDSMYWVLFADQYADTPASRVPVSVSDCSGALILE